MGICSIALLITQLSFRLLVTVLLAFGWGLDEVLMMIIDL
jgi:hypothetical protein